MGLLSGHLRILKMSNHHACMLWPIRRGDQGVWKEKEHWLAGAGNVDHTLCYRASVSHYIPVMTLFQLRVNTQRKSWCQHKCEHNMHTFASFFLRRYRLNKGDTSQRRSAELFKPTCTLTLDEIYCRSACGKVNWREADMETRPHMHWCLLHIVHGDVC